MAYTGSQCVTKHKAALSRCKNLLPWDMFECVVDEMRKEYGKD